MTVDLPGTAALAGAVARPPAGGDGQLWQLASALRLVKCPECEPRILGDDHPLVAGVPGGWREVLTSLRWAALVLVEHAIRDGLVMRPWTVYGGGMYIGVGAARTDPPDFRHLDGMAVRGRADCPHDDFAEQPAVSAWDARGPLTLMTAPGSLSGSGSPRFKTGPDAPWGGLGTLALIDDTTERGSSRDSHTVLRVGVWAPGGHDLDGLAALEGALRAGAEPRSLAELHALAGAVQPAAPGTH